MPQDEVGTTQTGSIRLIDRATLLGVALCFLLPFVQPYHAFPLPSFEAEWLAGALLSATLLIAALAAKQKDKAMLQWPLPAFLRL